jgi:hypothetical protein
MKYTESDLEQAAIEWFQELGYSYAFGPDIEPGSEKPERENFSDVVLAGRLRAAIAKINSGIPFEAQEEAAKKVSNVTNFSSRLGSNNREFHKYLVNGVDVEYRRADGSIAGDKVWLIDRRNLDNNDWLVIMNLHLELSDFWLREPTAEDRETMRRDRQLFGHFVSKVEQLLDQYHEPKYDRYTYVRSLPAGVYKSLEKLMTECLLPTEYQKKIYREYLNEQQGATNLHSRNLAMSQHLTTAKITAQRTEIERELTKRLKQVDSPFTFQHILDLIYHENSQKDLDKIIRIFGSNNISELQHTLDLVTAAWNYFPHKSFNGKSPIEMF